MRIILSLCSLALATAAAPGTPPVVDHPAPAAPVTFTVNSTSDAAADFTGDPDFTICRTNVANSTCTLRAAIMNADQHAGSATINLPAGVYLLTLAGAGEDAALTGDLDITGTLTLTGAGQASTIVDGNGLDRVFQILAGSTATISGVTIQNGHSGTAFGGGLYNSGTLTLISSTVSGNTAAYNSGGGLYNSGTLTLTGSAIGGNTAPAGGGLYNSGTLTLAGSAISGNSAGIGGGLYNTGTLTLTNSTVSSNVVYNNGGGLYNAGRLTLTSSAISGNSAYSGGGLGNAGKLTLTDSTVNGNTASSAGGGLYNGGKLTLTNSTVNGNTASYAGGGLYNGGLYNGGTLTLTNSTVSGNVVYTYGGGLYNNSTLTLIGSTISRNTTSGSGGGLYSVSGTITVYDSLLAGNGTDCSATLSSQGYNLIQNTTNCIITGTLTGVISGTDPLLGPLQANGGPTFTHALLAGSPAINAGDPAGCKDAIGNSLSADQRGAPRVGRCDIGAYEAGLSASKSVSGTFTPGGRVTYTVSLSNPGGSLDLTNVTLTDTLPAQVTYLPNSLSGNKGTAAANSSVITWSGTVLSNTETVISFGATISDTARSVVITNTALSSWGGVTIPSSASFDTTTRLYLPVIASSPPH